MTGSYGPVASSSLKQVCQVSPKVEDTLDGAAAVTDIDPQVKQEGEGHAVAAVAGLIIDPGLELARVE